MAYERLGVVLRQIRSFCLRDAADVDDRQLLERFLTLRDEAAFEALLRRHGRMVYGVCRRLLSDSHDVEDAFQTTFLVLLRRASSLARRELLANWLYGVAYRTALHARSRAVRQRARQERLEDVPEIASVAEEVGSDVRMVLDDEVNRLPQKYRAPVVLCYLEGKTLAEAARQLGWPAGMVSGRLARARELLRKRLTRRGVTLSAGLPLEALFQTGASIAPPSLTAAALRCATTYTAGGTIASSVTALTKGVLYAMFLTKVKTATMVLIALSVLTMGAGLITYAVAVPQAKSDKGTDPASPAQAKDKQESQPAKEEPFRQRLVNLLKARVEVARIDVQGRTEQYQKRGGILDSMLPSLERLLHAELEMAIWLSRIEPKGFPEKEAQMTPEARARLQSSRELRAQLPVYEAHLKRVKSIEEICREHFQAGRVPEIQMNQAIYYRLQAEIQIETTRAQLNPRLLKADQPAKDGP